MRDLMLMMCLLILIFINYYPSAAKNQKMAAFPQRRLPVHLNNNKAY